MNFNVKYLYFALMIAGISAVTYKLNIPFLNLATGRGYSAFFLGMLFYYIYENVPKKIMIAYSFLCLALCGVCAVLKNGIDDQWGIFTFMIWPSVLIIFLSCEKLFSWKVFSLLGAISFEMYLWHSAILLLFFAFKNKFFYNSFNNLEMFLITLFIILFSILMYKIETRVMCLYKNKKMLRK